MQWRERRAEGPREPMEGFGTAVTGIVVAFIGWGCMALAFFSGFAYGGERGPGEAQSRAFANVMLGLLRLGTVAEGFAVIVATVASYRLVQGLRCGEGGPGSRAVEGIALAILTFLMAAPPLLAAAGFFR